MSSEKVVFEGKAKWANVPPRAAKKGYETEDTNYSILVECSKERFKELLAKKIPALTKLVEEDGTTYIRVKATKTKGEMVFNDIPVVDEYGDRLESNIGNGSTVKVVASLDDIKGKNGKALRLKGVQVVDLVEYNDSDKDVFAGVTEFKTKPKSQSTLHESTPFDTDDNLFS